MMTELVLSVCCDNAAFAPDPMPEIRTILTWLVTRIEMEQPHRHGYYSGNVRDSNGNRVGWWRLDLSEGDT
jgi:hypothetical protein